MDIFSISGNLSNAVGNYFQMNGSYDKDFFDALFYREENKNIFEALRDNSYSNQRNKFLDNISALFKKIDGCAKPFKDISADADFKTYCAIVKSLTGIELPNSLAASVEIAINHDGEKVLKQYNDLLDELTKISEDLRKHSNGDAEIAKFIKNLASKCTGVEKTACEALKNSYNNKIYIYVDSLRRACRDRLMATRNKYGWDCYTFKIPESTLSNDREKLEAYQDSLNKIKHVLYTILEDEKYTEDKFSNIVKTLEKVEEELEKEITALKQKVENRSDYAEYKQSEVASKSVSTPFVSSEGIYHDERDELVQTISEFKNRNDMQFIVNLVVENSEKIINSPREYDMIAKEIDSSSINLEVMKDILIARKKSVDIRNADELKAYADNILKSMLVCSDMYKVSSVTDVYEKNLPIKRFYRSLLSSETLDTLLEKYTKEYEKFRKENPNQNISGIISPEGLKRMYNTEAEKYVNNNWPQLDHSTFVNAFRLMNVKDISDMYERIYDEKRIHGQDSISDLQEEFARIIETRMKPISDNLPDEKKEEIYRIRMSAIINDFFAQTSFKEEYKIDIEEGYASKRIESVETIKEAERRYYKRSKVEQVLGRMNLSKLNRLKKQEYMHEDEMEEVKGMFK